MSLSLIILNNASNVQAKPVTKFIFKFYLYQCLNFLPFIIIIDSAWLGHKIMILINLS